MLIAQIWIFSFFIFEHEASPGMGIEGIRMADAGLEFEETPIEELLQKYERDFANRASHSSVSIL